MKYDTVIFDKDGVLLDSAIDNFKWADQIRVKKAKELGINLTIEESRQIVGSDTLPEIEHFMNKHGLDWDQLTKIEKEVQERKMNMIENGQIHLFPNVKKVLDSLDVSKAVVTNAPKQTTDFTMNYFNLGGYFKEIRCPDMMPIQKYFQKKKPHPGMIKQVVKDVGAENPVMVGDTSTDIGAAQNAGIDSILVNAYKEREIDAATHTVRHLDEIKKFVN